MIKRLIITTFLFTLFTFYICFAQTNNPLQIDVCVYGGTSGGVIAAYRAKKGKKCSADRAQLADGVVKNEGDVQVGGFGPYPISYRSIIPKASESTNLFVPVCLSATHIAYGSIRMEPVFMVLAQSAASIAIDRNTPVQKVDVKTLQQLLKNNPLADGSQPEILIDNADKANTKMQGNWVADTKQFNRYGVSLVYLKSKAQPEESHFKFTPSITKTGKYKVYVYCPQIENQAAGMKVLVNAASGLKESRIDTGKNANEWVLMSDYTFEKGNKGYIAIAPDAATEGVVVADAVLLIPH